VREGGRRPRLLQEATDALWCALNPWGSIFGATCRSSRL
jgi:hypothetical protein